MTSPNIGGITCLIVCLGSAAHRAHHSARYMSVRIVYRNSLVYYALMPGLWLSAALLHFSFGSTYMVYIVYKMSVITGAHSSVAWDEPLLSIPSLADRCGGFENHLDSNDPCRPSWTLEDDEATHYKGTTGISSSSGTSFSERPNQ